MLICNHFFSVPQPCIASGGGGRREEGGKEGRKMQSTPIWLNPTVSNCPCSRWHGRREGERNCDIMRTNAANRAAREGWKVVPSHSRSLLKDAKEIPFKHLWWWRQWRRRAEGASPSLDASLPPHSAACCLSCHIAVHFQDCNGTFFYNSWREEESQKATCCIQLYHATTWISYFDWCQSDALLPHFSSSVLTPWDM